MLRSLVLYVLILAGCDPYLTRKIDNVSEKQKSDSIFLVGPLIEGRIQINKDKYTGDYDSEVLTRVYTKKALHQILDGHLCLEYDTRDPVNSWRIKAVADSILIRFTQTKYTRTSILGKLLVPSNANLILIPYVIWTRTTPDFESEKCGKVGYRDYFNRNTCTWTRVETFLFLVNRTNSEILFFKDYVSMRDFPVLPSEEKIALSLNKCSRQLLHKLRCIALKRTHR